jgi:hypothetical protein
VPHFGLGALPVGLWTMMGNISTVMVVVYWLLISGMTNSAEKMILILLIKFLNGVP